jgi:tripeptidyl-peptidase-1
MYEFATDLFNAKSKPLVVSMSWGWPEPRQCEVGQCTNSKDYVTRVNTEFMKITGTGITLTAASGDQGAPGDTNPYCESSSTPISTIFPGASPWVLSVGATMTVKSGEQAEQFSAPACQQFPCATSAAETSCTYPTSLITSGGGFSNYVTRPSWQDAAVKAYLSSGVKLPSAQYYSAGNRAFPDVSANGHSYLIAINQQLEQVDGTSASSPVWAAVISLLNDVRLDAGKAPLGFVNPLLYTVYAKQPTAFHDITTGNNLCTESCCSQVGYYATKGWDAVTGLGSPNGQALIDYVKTLA